MINNNSYNNSIKNTVQAIILAAGKSSRFNTKQTKLLAPICGQPMILYPIKLFQSLEIPITVVLGYQKEDIQQIITEQIITQQIIEKTPKTDITFAVQEIQKGTGHALLCTKHYWQADTILIVNGDMPLISQNILEQLFRKHAETSASISLVTAEFEYAENSGYGRVMEIDNHVSIVEAKHLDASNYEERTINAGIYFINRSFLQNYIDMLTVNSDTQEIYITDLIEIASRDNQTVSLVSAPFDHICGINTLAELTATEQIKQTEIIKNWMDKGVRFAMPQTTRVDLTVVIEPDTYIKSGVHLTGNTHIGAHSHIGEFSILHNAIVEAHVTVQAHTIIHDSHIKTKAIVGPFAHIRNNAIIENATVIGNFVEIKNSEIGTHTNIKHLSFIGDAHVGHNVNIGAGTITCNYDGVNKHKTYIGDHSFIGSNNTLVAPLIIHNNAYTAAGSTITKQVPEHALAFGRAFQINKENYKKKRDITSATQKQNTLSAIGDPDFLPGPEGAQSQTPPSGGIGGAANTPSTKNKQPDQEDKIL